MLKPLLITLIAFLPLLSDCQQVKVSHLWYRTISDQVEIFYNLPEIRKPVYVQVYLRSKAAPAKSYRLRNASGSVGTGRFSGKGQKIVWMFRHDPAYLMAQDAIYFEVKAVIDLCIISNPYLG